MKPNLHPAKILFVHGSNDLYGGEVILLELIKRLDRGQFEPIVVLPQDMRHLGRFSRRLDEEEIPYRFIRMAVIRRRYFSPLGLLAFVRDVLAGVVTLMYLIWRERVALVHSNTIAVPCGALAARFMRRPGIWHIHEIVTRPAVMPRLLHPVVCALSTQVVAVSEAVRSHILTDCPGQANKVHVIHNGIDFATFALSESASRETGTGIRRQFGIPQSAFLVGMVGKVCRWKGQLLLVEAAKIVTQQSLGVRFLAVGGVFDDEMHFMSRFRRSVTEAGLGEVFAISDYRSDIPEVLGALDLFILPSTEPDPFPTVVLEAMAAGKPVIACNHGGAPEMLAESETGLLFPPGCAAPLAEAILRLADDPSRARAMGRAGQERVRAQFQAERYASDFQALYRRWLPRTAGLSDVPEVDLPVSAAMSTHGAHPPK
ncbi:MAG: glycosyltransferase family 4 protein [Candidatus Sulfotelmatobacter sp.]